MLLHLICCAILLLLSPYSAGNVIVLRGNSTIQSQNGTFELLFFSTGRDTAFPSGYYLGIRYVSVPTPTYVWVGNRDSPAVTDSPILFFTSSGQLAIIIGSTNTTIWETPNETAASEVVLLETGNLVLLSSRGSTLWQSFDDPTDTWLPGMTLTSSKYLISWKTSDNPAPGFYSLRLDPHRFNQFQLFYNGTIPYWTTGNWSGASFAGIPEMTIPYIYAFHFENPFGESAAFWYTEMALDGNSKPPLTRFRLEANGLFRQYTWSQQTENWDMFWSRPINVCKVYGFCGAFGLCNGTDELKPCTCLSGFNEVKEEEYEVGCERKGDSLYHGRENDEFIEVGEMASFGGVEMVPYMGMTKDGCRRTCLANFSCVAFNYELGSRLCDTFYGRLMNLRDTSDANAGNALYVRIGHGASGKRSVFKSVTILRIVVILFVVLVTGVAGVLAVILVRRIGKGKSHETGSSSFPVMHLKMFSYKELYAATKGFSAKLGHGGFGVVFWGELEDCAPVAVKRLERPGSGEKEFRAEVRTIGNIQHVNLVRLRGFCSEGSHRLLVYDYMPNASLSVYLQRDGPNLSWDIRFSVALGTAKGIAYLHESCRDCIIHCDIKPENILLDANFVAKVSDFGLAKLIGRDFSRVLATMRGTWGYVAPEWISGVAITTKADVYSYGMTLLELLGGRRNVKRPPCTAGAVIENGESWFFPPYAAERIIEGNIAAVVDDRLGNTYNVEESTRLALTAIWCIQDDDEMRPTMGMVVNMLEGIVEVMTPPLPKLLQALNSGESYRGLHSHSADLVGESNVNSKSSPACNSSPANS